VIARTSNLNRGRAVASDIVGDHGPHSTQIANPVTTVFRREYDVDIVSRIGVRHGCKIRRICDCECDVEHKVVFVGGNPRRACALLGLQFLWTLNPRRTPWALASVARTRDLRDLRFAQDEGASQVESEGGKKQGESIAVRKNCRTVEEPRSPPSALASVARTLDLRDLRCAQDGGRRLEVGRGAVKVRSYETSQSIADRKNCRTAEEPRSPPSARASVARTLDLRDLRYAQDEGRRKSKAKVGINSGTKSRFERIAEMECQKPHERRGRRRFCDNRMLVSI
jgi:hypothetical protein